MKIHINADRLLIGINPNSLVQCPGVGTELANIPENISAIAVATNNIPIKTDLYLTGANFEIKLNPIGTINNSAIAKNIWKKIIQISMITMFLRN